MKSKALKILLLILIVVIATGVLFACKDNGDGGTPVAPDNSADGDTSSASVSKSEIAEAVEQALLNAGSRVKATTKGTRHVTSEYTLRVNSVNLTAYYEANYDLDKKQDSEIMLRIYDYFANDTVAFVYYDGKDLYFAFKEQKIKITSFGGSSSFETFYNFISLADMSGVMFEESLASNINSMISFAESKNISTIRLSESSSNITVKDINLDKSKPLVNDFINDKIATLGNKFDVLTSYFLGFELSDLAKVQIGRFTAQEVFVLRSKLPSDDYVVDEIKMTFAGNQTNNVDDYYFNAQYATSYEKKEIKLDKFVDPDTNKYSESMLGHQIFTGTLAIPSLDEELNAEIRTVLDTEDNLKNKISATFDNSTGASAATKEIAFYYKDGVAYLDCGGFINKHFGRFVEYEALGLPKLKFTTVNVTDELRKIGLNLLAVASESMDIDALLSDEDTDARLKTLIDKSSGKDGVFTILVDSEFVKNVIGGKAQTLTEIIAEYFGVNDGVINEILELGYLDNLALEISFNTKTGGIVCDLLINEKSEITLSLVPCEVPDEGVDVLYPERADYFEDGFSSFIEPEIVTVDFDISMHTSDSDNGNISTFMGLFVGDVTGNNTPYPLAVSDTVSIIGSVSQKDGNIYVNAKVSINGVEEVAFVSDLDNADVVYVDNKRFGVKYTMSQTAMGKLLAQIAADGNVWTTKSIVETVKDVAESANVRLSGDKLKVTVNPSKNSLGEKVDPFYMLLGIKEFNAEIEMNARFDMLDGLVGDASEYVNPQIVVREEEIFDSIYHATWQEVATVLFDDKPIEFKLTFAGESAQIVSGKYDYRPVAELFGKEVVYSMRLTDNVNGTKPVLRLQNALMVIDPIEEEAMPQRIPVVYDDGKEGELDYRIIGFPYNNDNIDLLMQGKARAKYVLVIGEGSIAETKFDIELEVKGRELKTETDERYNDIPIVAHVSIDPYDYSIRRRTAISGATDFYPIIYRREAEERNGVTVNPQTLVLTFYKNANTTETYEEYLDYEWENFDESRIKYVGNAFTITGSYKKLTIAIHIEVQDKEVNGAQGVQVLYRDGDVVAEAPGIYTVDTLDKDSYTIPTKTVYDEKGNIIKEVRIYFKSGKYRLVGEKWLGKKAEGVTYEYESDVNFDGFFYPSGIEWKHDKASYFDIDGSGMPFENDKSPINTATIYDDLVGDQNLVLEVVVPSRRIQSSGDTENCVVNVEYEEDGATVKENGLITDFVQASDARFKGADGTYSKYYEFDPYGYAVSLPDKVYLNVSFAGAMRMRGYPIVWDASNGIVDAEGKIRIALATETYLAVHGTVGNGTVMQRLTMVIHNGSGRYSNIVLYNEDGSECAYVTRRYGADGAPIAQDDVTTEVAIVLRGIEGLNPYAELKLPHSLKLEFPKASGIADRHAIADWKIVVDGETVSAKDFVPSPQGGQYVIFTEVASENGGLLKQKVELCLWFDKKEVTTSRIYGVCDAADGGSIIQIEEESRIITYVVIDPYSSNSQELYDKITGGITKIGVGFNDGTMVEGIPVTWINIDELKEALCNPVGSDYYYNNGKYKNGILFLRGTIRAGTVQEAEVSMGFMITPRILGSINLNNIETQYLDRDADGNASIQLETEIQRYVEDPVTGEVSSVGENVINVVFNKIFTLRVVEDEIVRLVSPSEYVDHILSAVSLTFANEVVTNKVHYVLPKDFDAHVYGTATEPNPAVVSDNGNYVTIRFTIEKLSDGSCLQPFAVSMSFRKDKTLIGGEDAVGESVELFDADGNPLYETTDGYVISDSFVVEYKHSGKVTYNSLVWRAEETVISASGTETINVGSEVKNIGSEFFGFMGTRTIKLRTTLPNGEQYRRHISFYSKNVNGDRYSTADGKYKVIDGTLTINNVYEYMPVDSIIENIAVGIVPNETDSYISEYPITFPLIDGWKPSAIFAKADNPDEFDTEVLSARINSTGLPRTLFATGKIRGYNNEMQEVKLYIRVMTLAGGQISHPDYTINHNNLVFDQYAKDTNDGTFVLPKDITITFGSGDNAIRYTFDPKADIKYLVRAKDADVYEEVQSITYNSKGHTLDPAVYGAPNDELLLMLVLPDGNDRLKINVKFPNREIEKVSYLHDTETDGVYIEGRYYVDPYDKDTYTLPAKAGFTFKGADETIAHSVKWTPYGRAESVFEQDDNGNYRYIGGNTDSFGKSYVFYSALRSFDDNDVTQYFVMQVFVLDRHIYELPTELRGMYEILNPFTTIVKDLPSTIPNDNFVTLDSSATSEDMPSLLDFLRGKEDSTISCFTEFVSNVYGDYVDIKTPVLPDIVWYKEEEGVRVPLTDDDISVFGGFNYNIYGVLGYGKDRSAGEVITLKLVADEWQFKEIDGIRDYLIEVNEHTGISIADSFIVSFTVTAVIVNGDGSLGTTTSTQKVTFYPEDRATAEGAPRAVIKWHYEDSDTVGSFASAVFVNTYKTDASNEIVTESIYRLDKQMIGIDAIDFGYGYGESGSVELVIDPLNPNVPLRAEAKGKLQTDAGTVMDLGEVIVDWTVKDASDTESIYNMPIAGGMREIVCDVYVPGSTERFHFTVRVTFLNRRPYGIYTEERGYSYNDTIGADGYYTLLQTTDIGGAEQRISRFSVNPTPQNADMYVLDPEDSNVYYRQSGSNEYLKSAYVLPSKLRITFPAYAAGTLAQEALSELGEVIYFEDIKWVLSRNISLIGTDVEGGAITAMIRSFKLYYYTSDGKEVTAEYDFLSSTGTVLGGQYDISLSTQDRTVVSTYVDVDGEQKLLSSVPENSEINYQKASDEFYIDPYAIAFPEDVYIRFNGMSTDYHATDIEWTYDEKYIERTDVISGRIGNEFMFIMASMKVFGAELSIQFAIKGRNIDITVKTPDGEDTQEPLSGGTLYVIRGIPIEKQLPDHLYYRFEYDDGTSQIASVPLEFSKTGLANISTEVAGRTYSNVKATLGAVDDDNIRFTIIVIDPKLYMVYAEEAAVTIGGNTVTPATYTKGGYYNDFISVGVNAFGAYVAGPEAGLLPTKVIVTDEGAYMDIVDITYDVANLVAIVKCKYTFRSFRDSSNISGDEEGYGENSDKMYISFTVPIRTYRYNTIEAGEAEFSKQAYAFPLGEDIKASDMPDTLSGITPFWEMSNINRNRAGTYEATCYFKNAYGKIVTGTISVIIEKAEITADDIEWIEVGDVNFLDRIYSGTDPLDVREFIKIKDFLREDGNIGALEGYTVLYSMDNGVNWSPNQPVYVKATDAPDYLVRILVDEKDDYNVRGYIDYTMKIGRCVIDIEKVFFHNGNGSKINPTKYEYVNNDGQPTYNMERQITFEYNGEECLPNIAGIPAAAKYDITFALYDPNSTNQNYNPSVRPVNAGVYLMKLEFSNDQRNYSIEAGTNFTIVIIITEKHVVYSLQQEIAYTGEYMDAIIVGLPESLGSLVMYSYYSKDDNRQLAPGERIRDAGTYTVTATVTGDGNYPSGIVSGDVTISKRDVVLSINTIESEYLDSLKPLDSAITVVGVGEDEPGLVGADTMRIFGDVEVIWDGGTLTDKHMVGVYTLVLKETLTHRNYNFVAINSGEYHIVAYSENTKVIDNKEQFIDEVAKLKDGDVARWYLRADNYGDMVIDKNVSVSIIGSYDLTSAKETIAVEFDTITLNKGTIQLDIVKVKNHAGKASISIGEKAGNLSITRSEFAKKDNTAMLTQSVAIRSKVGYTGVVSIDGTTFSGYQRAVYLEGGSIEVTASTFSYNVDGIVVEKGSIMLRDNTFTANSGYAVGISANTTEASILNNTFDSNYIAIRNGVALRRDIEVLNKFIDNGTDYYEIDE